MDSVSALDRRWLIACAVAAVLANLAGGFSMAATSVFIVICLTGLMLIGPEPETVEAEPYPDDEVTRELEAEATDVEPEAQPDAERREPTEEPEKADAHSSS